jgi:hypothetical protein
MIRDGTMESCISPDFDNLSSGSFGKCIDQATKAVSGQKVLLIEDIRHLDVIIWVEL